MDLKQAAAGIGALADDTRRELYLLVCSQPEPISRDQAADMLDIPRHQAKFHLDRLAEGGLLSSEYARISGKTGPGAGRPAKLYRRAGNEIAVSLPDREYALAGRLMAESITTSARTGQPVLTVLQQIAARVGFEIGAAAAEAQGRPTSVESALRLALDVLIEHGYEPSTEDGITHLRNCPFHALAAEQTELVCGMNHALIGGIVDALPPCPSPRLKPGEDRCCVVLAEDDPEEA